MKTKLDNDSAFDAAKCRGYIEFGMNKIRHFYVVERLPSLQKSQRERERERERGGGGEV